MAVEHAIVKNPSFPRENRSRTSERTETTGPKRTPTSRRGLAKSRRPNRLRQPHFRVPPDVGQFGQEEQDRGLGGRAQDGVVVAGYQILRRLCSRDMAGALSGHCGSARPQYVEAEIPTNVTGQARCSSLAPELFRLDEYGYVRETMSFCADSDLIEGACIARANCPEEAIIISEP